MEEFVVYAPGREEMLEKLRLLLEESLKERWKHQELKILKDMACNLSKSHEPAINVGAGDKKWNNTKEKIFMLKLYEDKEKDPKEILGEGHEAIKKQDELRKEYFIEELKKIAKLKVEDIEDFIRKAKSSG